MRTFFFCAIALFILTASADSRAQQTITYGRCVTIRSTYTNTFNNVFGNIERYDIRNNQASKFGVIYNGGNARNANISPDGNKVSFIRQDNRICIINIDGSGSVQVLGTVANAGSAWCDWPMPDWIYFSTQWSPATLARINVNTQQVQQLGNVAVSGLWTISISQDGTRACISADDGGWTSSLLEIVNNQITGKRKVGACGGSISPDGALYTINNGPHTCAWVYRWDGGTEAEWCTSKRSSAGPNWNRQRWSSNSRDWVCYTQGAPFQLENYHNMVLYYVPDKGTTNIQVTNNSQGQYNEADDLWIQHHTAPAVNFSPSNLAFSAEQGKTAPSAKTVAVTNAGAGTFPALSASSNRNWLSVSISGSGNNYTITNTVNHTGLAGGVHNATVTVSGSNIEASSYSVELTVVSPPVLTSITVEKGEVVPGGSVQCVAKGYDQFNKLMNPQPAFAWTVISGGGTINAAGIYTAGTGEGTATIRASSGSVNGTGTVTVAVPPPIHIKVDCGKNPIAGWESDAKYLVNGNEWMPEFKFAGPVDVSGALNPAPAAVYLSAPLSRERNSYSFDVPAGVYLVRLHSMLGSGHTGIFKMDFYIGGEKVLDDFDPRAAAGGFDRAVVREFTVTVNDGNGLKIEGINDGGVSVYLCGIEVIWRSEILGPAITLLSPKGGEMFRSGETMVIAWEADPARVTAIVIELSTDYGLTWVPISGSRSIEPFNESKTTGLFSWPVDAEFKSNECLIRIFDYVDRRLDSEMDAPFGINDKSGAVPADGKRYRRDSFGIIRMQTGCLAVTVPEGRHEVAVYSLRGSVIMRHSGERTALYPIDGKGGVLAGTYVVEVQRNGERRRALLTVTR